MEIKKVGVAGCGQMGNGIVIVCAQAGYQVVVSEIDEEVLNKKFPSINSFLSKSVEKGKITQENKDAAMARVKSTTNIEDFSDCDIVIEAITENMDMKKKLFAGVSKICPEHTILASNTSCLSIIDLAMETRRPEKVLGLHFFNPVPIMNLLEIVRTIATSDETLEICKSFGTSLGKPLIIAKDTPGFIVNRLLQPYLNNAIRMLEEGVATREDIDTGIRLGLNHPMGPLTLADMIGLDTELFITIAMYDEFKEPQYAPPTLLKKMVSAGWLGRKSGKGFYDYT